MLRRGSGQNEDVEPVHTVALGLQLSRPRIEVGPHPPRHPRTVLVRLEPDGIVVVSPKGGAPYRSYSQERDDRARLPVYDQAIPSAGH